MHVKLIAPVALEKRLRFAIREGGRTVGAGVVARIVERMEAGEEMQTEIYASGSRPSTIEFSIHRRARL